VKILVDMCLSPEWVDYLATQDIEAQHWADLGDPRASDRVIMDFARRHQMVVFTHDLDFGAILTLTQAVGPSVIQVRSKDPVPEVIGFLVASAIMEHGAHLIAGALLTVEPDRMRVRILPITRGTPVDGGE
jgi:predicted nuclease of predicted toxin-antitoxin system